MRPGIARRDVYIAGDRSRISLLVFDLLQSSLDQTSQSLYYLSGYQRAIIALFSPFFLLLYHVFP